MGVSIQPIVVRFQASGMPQVQGAFNQLANGSRQAGAAVGNSFVAANGRVTAFGRQSVTALNATGFAISSLASTGQVGFKSLASSAAGFASFFGPAGLIATGVISLGLVLADFWNKQRKEIEETQKRITSGLAAAASRRERDEPVAVAAEALAQARADIEANRRAMAELFDIQKRTVQLKEGTFVRPVDQQALARLTKERVDLLTVEFEKLRALNDARAKAATETGKGTAGTTAQSTALRDAERALEAEIAALVALGKAQQLSTADFARATALEQQYAAVVRDTSRALTERADALQKSTGLAAAITIPAPQVRDIIDTQRNRAPGPAVEIPPVKIPPVDLTKAVPDRAFQEMQQFIAQGLATSIVGGITQGFAQGLAQGGIEGGLKAMTAQILGGLGNMLASIAAKALEAAILSSQIMTFLIANPWAAIAAAVALSVLAASLGGGSGGGGGGRSFGGTANPSPVNISRLIVDPNFRQPVRATAQQPFAGATLLSVDRPEGQRVLAKSVDSFNRRRG